MKNTADQKSSSKMQYEILPNEIWILIFQYLASADLVNTALVCSAFNRLVQQTALLNRVLSPIEKIVTCSYHTAILTRSGDVYACGINNYGQLGVGDFEDRSTFTRLKVPNGTFVKDIAVREGCTMFLGQDNQLYFCGKFPAYFGDKNFPIMTKLPLPEDLVIQNIGAGGLHYHLVCKNGEIYISGRELVGNLGLNKYKPDKQFTWVNCVAAGIKIKKIFIGPFHSFILTEQGHLYASGKNADGQLGLGDNNKRPVLTRVNLPQGIIVEDLAVGNYYTMLLNSAGEVYACGRNDDGQLGLGDNENRNTFTKLHLPNDIKIKKIITGGWHTVLVDVNEVIYVCGANRLGQLGLGDTNNRNTITELSLPSPIKVKAIAAYHSTMILSDSDDIFACGDNPGGLLGLANNYEPTVTGLPHYSSWGHICIKELLPILNKHPQLSNVRVSTLTPLKFFRGIDKRYINLREPEEKVKAAFQ